ncbi:MAG: hypothetical protein JO167_12360 [Alphaproteobacteria bacterium]|nr:hypothetical protein [Alphaproteobacteria bacterium]MBV9542049.1 hypothetical protein [Alphaproteobacteria bacterium]
MAKSKKKIFFPKIRLAELVARGGGISRDQAVEGAMKTLEDMRGKADLEIQRSIAAMETIVGAHKSDPLDVDKMTAILRHADQIVTLAGTFCYEELDVAAKSLCDITDGLLRIGQHDHKPIAVHVHTLRLLAPGAPASLSPEHAHILLGELAKVSAYLNFGSLAAAGADDAAPAAR